MTATTLLQQYCKSTVIRSFCREPHTTHYDLTKAAHCLTQFHLSKTTAMHQQTSGQEMRSTTS
eukprot:14665-Heterococcus_DN1.PRE.2